jgi:hypothetical protein
MAFKKGESGNPAGRKVGTKNRFTTLKAAFLDAFTTMGGTEALVAWANKSDHNRAIFYQMVTKLFPTEIVGGDESAAPIRVIYQLVEPPEGGNGDGGNGNEGKRGD